MKRAILLALLLGGCDPASETLPVALVETPLADDPCACLFGEVAVVGGDSTSAVELRTAGGGTVTMFMGKDPMFLLEHQPGWSLATFAGEVHALGYAGAPSPFLTSDTVLGTDVSTVRVSAEKGPVRIELPQAYPNPGRRFTVKKMGDGEVQIVGALVVLPSGDIDPTGATEPIDGLPKFGLEGPWSSAVFEAYVGPMSGYDGGWVVIGP